MVDEAKFPSPVCSTIEVLVVQTAVGHCCAELGPVCCSMPAAGIAVSSVSSITEHTSHM